MAIKGKNDTVAIKSKVQTTDGRGGVTTTYTTKIAELVCSLQGVRREEVRMDPQGQTITDPYFMSWDIITSGEVPEKGDIVESSVNGTFLIITLTQTSGQGAHMEAILRKVDGDAILK